MFRSFFKIPFLMLALTALVALPAAPGADFSGVPGGDGPRSPEQAGRTNCRLSGYGEDVIVYTAHQSWLSRIYILDMNGAVIKYFEYSFYYFADLEVVDNEVYVAEAFAPRVYKVDLQTGDLDLIIDDWSLYYFYDLAFDGTHFYLTEWSLNRYDINGNWQGSTSFDDVFGGAWDGSFYWTLTDEAEIKCWDITLWPNLFEITTNNFAPPSADCRGLWFDGEYFWTAESVDGALGKIYRFDHNGFVIEQWTEPAFAGWSACVIKDDSLHVDNGDGTFISVGDWHATTHADAHDSDLLYTGPGSGGRKAAWRVDSIVAPGESYDLFVWKFDHGWSSVMATDARYKVYHKNGISDSIPVDLSTPGDEWIFLGNFQFDNSSPQGVLLTNWADGFVIADAIRLVPTGTE